MHTLPLRFLVAEDNPVLVDIMLQTLGVIGAVSTNIKVGNTGKEALALLLDPVDLTQVLITDLEMPELDGYGLIEAVYAAPDLHRIKIILTTAVDPAKDERLAQFLKHHPRVYYLKKESVTPDSLRTALVRLIET
jgi:two-component system chemotaxis sensor kinase CheA